ncbi:MAG: hypothetical protein V4690_03500 [Patescibacteria group bacterium]
MDTKELAEARKCLQPWLDGVDLISKSKLKDEEVSTYASIISNHIVGKPVMEKGVKNFRHLTSIPVNVGDAWILLVPVCNSESLPTEWKKDMLGVNFLARHYPDVNAILFEPEQNLPRLLRGLVFLHEMRHGTQARFPMNGNNDPNYEFYREVDAYEFEFGILDRLNPTGYRSYLESEVRRVGDDFRKRGVSQPNLNYTLLKQIFPDLIASSKGVGASATVIFIRATFLLYDRSFSPDVAARKKIEMVKGFGSR